MILNTNGSLKKKIKNKNSVHDKKSGSFETKKIKNKKPTANKRLTVILVF
jgi:hypothetical protein